MSNATNASVLAALLDSWDRNNTILVNLLRALPQGALQVRAMEGGRTNGQLFMHMHFVRLVFVEEDAPEAARPRTEGEWRDEDDPERIAELLNESASAVRAAVSGRLAAGRPMDQHYDHPILMLQHLIWHEGYHHGQVKLALKLSGSPVTDQQAGPGTWGVWMRKA